MQFKSKHKKGKYEKTLMVKIDNEGERRMVEQQVSTTRHNQTFMNGDENPFQEFIKTKSSAMVETPKLKSTMKHFKN